MMSIFRIIVALGFGLTLCLPAPVHAEPIKFTYTLDNVFGTPLSGSSGFGFFTYDSSIVPTGGGGVIAVGLVTDFSLEFQELSYDESDLASQFQLLFFDAQGTLTDFVIGNQCPGSYCYYRVHTPGDFMLSSKRTLNFNNVRAEFSDRVGNPISYVDGRGTLAVSEPSGMSLAVLALAALAWSKCIQASARARRCVVGRSAS